MRAEIQVPDFVPVLSRGKHRRNGAKGGCFMEFASYLAGERWTDHPRCTHPLLAALARAVNDCTSDAGRARLVPLIPSVVGLVTADPRVDALIAARSARVGLSVAPPELARVMAVSLIAAERYLAVLDSRPVDDIRRESRLALRRDPAATRWAEAFIQQIGPVDFRDFGKRIGSNTVRQAVPAIARAAADRDEVLYLLLAGAIEDSAQVAAAEAADRQTVGDRMQDAYR